MSKPRQKLRDASAVGTATADGGVHQETPNSMTMHTTQCFRPHWQTGHDGERPERRGLLSFTGDFDVLRAAVSSRCLSSSAYNHDASRCSWISVKQLTDKTPAVLQSLSTIIDLISRDGSRDTQIARSVSLLIVKSSTVGVRTRELLQERFFNTSRQHSWTRSTALKPGHRR